MGEDFRAFQKVCDMAGAGGGTKPICGIIMPISSIDGCSEIHWAEVMEILTESIEDAGFGANIVSNSDESGIIHKRIIQNLYDNPIVVCDVSGKNPNVMFELGMRLAFDKPTIIIKDDQTNYSFDTSPIEHLSYPRDLRFSKIVEFKQRLSDKITSTYKMSQDDRSYTTFLKHFGEFTVAKLDKKEVPGQEYIIEEIRSLRRAINEADISDRLSRKLPLPRVSRTSIDVCLKGLSEKSAEQVRAFASAAEGVEGVRLNKINDDHYHIRASIVPFDADKRDTLQSQIRAMRRELVNV